MRHKGRARQGSASRRSVSNANSSRMGFGPGQKERGSASNCVAGHLAIGDGSSVVALYLLQPGDFVSLGKLLLSQSVYEGVPIQGMSQRLGTLGWCLKRAQKDTAQMSVPCFFLFFSFLGHPHGRVFDGSLFFTGFHGKPKASHKFVSNQSWPQEKCSG